MSTSRHRLERRDAITSFWPRAAITCIEEREHTWVANRGSESRLRIVTLTSACGQPGLCHMNLDLVVFVWLIALGWIKRNLVIRAGIRHTLLQFGRDVIAGVVSHATALGCKHLQPQVAYLHLTWLADSLEKFLPVEGAKPDVICA